MPGLWWAGPGRRYLSSPCSGTGGHGICSERAVLFQGPARQHSCSKVPARHSSPREGFKATTEADEPGDVPSVRCRRQENNRRSRFLRPSDTPAASSRSSSPRPTGASPRRSFSPWFIASDWQKERGTRNSSASLHMVRPAGFEPVAYRVGVLRPSKENPLRHKGFSRFAQLLAHF